MTPYLRDVLGIDRSCNPNLYLVDPAAVEVAEIQAVRTQAENYPSHQFLSMQQQKTPLVFLKKMYNRDSGSHAKIKVDSSDSKAVQAISHVTSDMTIPGYLLEGEDSVLLDMLDQKL